MSASSQESAKFQALPPLTSEEYAQLEQSILESGVKVPILVDERGTVIDGHHRQQIAKQHNLPLPTEICAGLTDTEKRSLALQLNVARRHLTREQKRAVVAESIKADPQLSDREHGRRTGVDHKTVSAIRDGLEKSGEIPHFSERIDPRSGNASQPASKPSCETDGPTSTSPTKPKSDTDYHAEADLLNALASIVRKDHMGEYSPKAKERLQKILTKAVRELEELM